MAGRGGAGSELVMAGGGLKILVAGVYGGSCGNG